MDSFFNVSKLVGVFVTPTNLLLLLLAGGFVASRFRRLHSWGTRLALVAGAALGAVAVLPIGDGMLVLLERRFSPLESCADAGRVQPTGVIVLGGAVGSIRIGDRFEVTLGEAAERVTYAAALARKYPSATVLVSGGQAFDNGSGRSEAEGMSELLVQLGVAPGRIRRESQSRTTAENAALVAEQTGSGRWLLVTSAFHMPRAIATFRQSGVDVVPAPTDRRVGDDTEPLLFSASDNLKKVDLAAREYFGLFAYWLGGRSNELFPGPAEDGFCG
jgi:uncharacterized SAM-binding protein YcdF (DUF218 family)